MFADFVKASGKTRASWAARIGVTASYLSDLLNGKKTPSLEVAVRIERETCGAIPAASWIPVADDARPLVPPSEDAA